MENGNAMTGWNGRIQTGLKRLAAAVVVWSAVSASGQTFWEGLAAAAEALSEQAEQSLADANIRALFAKAKAAEEDGAINFCGFYTGMPMADAEALAAHYGLKDGEGMFEENVGTHEVYSMHFSLHGVRRITKGGNSFKELAQAVANRVGSMQHKGGWGEPEWYEYKTIDGVTVTMSERNGCRIHDAPRAKAAENATSAEMTALLGKGTQAGEIKTITLRNGAPMESRGGAPMEMVWCPPGRFMMGSNDGDDDEKPVHEVTLTKGFWMAKTEVTQWQWKYVMGNEWYGEGDNLPVVMEWDDCHLFCQKAGLSLPTEAEWEYACRAGSTGKYGGTGRLADMGWYSANAQYKTHPVGQKQPNSWGLYDMHGNVSEWCWDDLGRYPSGAVTNPTGADGGDLVRRVRRGGGHESDASACRSANRGFALRGRDGFRPVAIGAEREESAKVAETVAVLGQGSQAGESRAFTLPGGATMEMVWCPPGSFTMGITDGWLTLFYGPAHEVTLTKGFWMAKTEVTQAQWQSVMGNNPSKHEGDNLPVENVSWNDCREFCQKAGLSLPTEAEWEYACRAGSTEKYGGTGNLEDMGWYDENSQGETHPVGDKKPNAWGLYDMHGNVCEWCADWADAPYPGVAVTNPMGPVFGREMDEDEPGVGSPRVVRSGSFGTEAGECQSASRGGGDPGRRDGGEDDGAGAIGFRPIVRQK
jgi:formylglycine-generating enzyme required for sulfatase activity